jgi:hypothetical protein
LAFFLEGEFTLLVVVLVLSSTAILASLVIVVSLRSKEAVAVGESAARCVGRGMSYLSLILGHIDGFSGVSLV